jgi:putative membrane protein
MNRQGLLMTVILAILGGCAGSKTTQQERVISGDQNTAASYYTDRAWDASSRNNATFGLRAMDADFLREANRANLASIAMGRLAVRQGGSDQVRTYGQRMIDDHMNMSEDLVGIARSKSVDLPTQLPSEAQSDVARLEGMSGMDFDREYTRQMVSDHQNVLDAFDRESRIGGDPQIRGFAARSLPIIQGNLQTAQDISQAMSAPSLLRRYPTGPRPSSGSPPTNVPSPEDLNPDLSVPPAMPSEQPR